MKILVYPHDLNIGGSQINAIDLAATHAADGHDVVIYGIEGPLVDYIEKKGLPFIAARELRYRPAPSRIVQLASTARKHRIDVIHGYEWPPCLDAYFAAHLVFGFPLLCTVLSMSVSPYVPPSIPLIMGTEQLAAAARQTRRDVRVLEPPIDIDSDRPGIDGRPFRGEHAVSDSELLIVTVSRLSLDLKLDALVDAIDAVGALAAGLPMRLVIVGDGEARAHLEYRALAVNEQTGGPTVSFAGALTDPRPAYAAADIVLGMGGSALRAMAIGKPVVVQGERGFSLPFKPETKDIFLWQGFWGVGDGLSGTVALARSLEALAVDGGLRSRLGAYGRTTVVERFSLRRGADIVEGIYGALVTADRPAASPAEAVRMAARALQLEVHQHRPSVKRRRASDELARLESAAVDGPAGDRTE